MIFFKRDCTRIGLLNCGPHTCGMTQKICNDDIANIIKDIIIGLGKLFLDVVTFGLSNLFFHKMKKNSLFRRFN